MGAVGRSKKGGRTQDPLLPPNTNTYLKDNAGVMTSEDFLYYATKLQKWTEPW